MTYTSLFPFIKSLDQIFLTPTSKQDDFIYWKFFDSKNFTRKKKSARDLRLRNLHRGPPGRYGCVRAGTTYLNSIFSARFRILKIGPLCADIQPSQYDHLERAHFWLQKVVKKGLFWPLLAFFNQKKIFKDFLWKILES